MGSCRSVGSRWKQMMKTGPTEPSPEKVTWLFFFFLIYTFLEVCSVQFFVSIIDFRSQFLAPFGVFVVFYVGIQCQSFVYMSKVKILLQLDSTWDRVLLRRIKCCYVSAALCPPRLPHTHVTCAKFNGKPPSWEESSALYNNWKLGHGTLF